VFLDVIIYVKQRYCIPTLCPFLMNFQSKNTYNCPNINLKCERQKILFYISLDESKLCNILIDHINLILHMFAQMFFCTKKFCLQFLLRRRPFYMNDDVYLNVMISFYKK
jgi:hypothetical protein